MYHLKSKYLISFFVTLFFFEPIAVAQNKLIKLQALSAIEKRNVEAHMEFLASDALQGRGSGTRDELIAATYFGSLMKQFGIKPAGDKTSSDKTSYIQKVNITRNIFVDPPKLTAQNITLEHGKDMLVLLIGKGLISAPLSKVNVTDDPKEGAINFVQLKGGEDEKTMNQNMAKFVGSKASAIIIEESPRWRNEWEYFKSVKPSFENIDEKNPKPLPTLIVLNRDSANLLSNIVNGTIIEIGGKLAEPKIRNTWNAVGMIKGSDPRLSSEVVLLSAHLDHLGIDENEQGEDKIFNGADDNASGCIAVIELGRVISQGRRPKRTVYFVFFGSEEDKFYGSRHFAENLAFSKDKVVLNLGFEMLGHPDPSVGRGKLALTGYYLSNLGPELVKHGAKLVPDPYPEQNYFERSDNVILARQGIISHTVFGYGRHDYYHQVTDEIETIDIRHLTNSINSMIKPIEWIVNSDFKPTWNEGKKP